MPLLGTALDVSAWGPYLLCLKLGHKSCLIQGWLLSGLAEFDKERDSSGNWVLNFNVKVVLAVCRAFCFYPATSSSLSSVFSVSL